MNVASRPKRPLGIGGYLLGLLGISLIGGLLGGLGALLGDQPGPLGLAITAGGLVAGLALAFAATIWWWRGIDEAAREAHKWAWWWGGTGGMAVGAILLVTLTARDDLTPVETLNLSAAELVVSGMMSILLFQLAGYSLAWAVWWLRRR